MFNPPGSENFAQIDAEIDAEIGAEIELDLAAVCLDFDRLGAELHYCEARELLRTWMTKLDLSERERSSLSPLLLGLEETLDRLETGRIQIAAFGMVGRGKSSLLNALAGQTVFETGPLHGVTQTIGSSQWQPSQWQLTRTAIAGTDATVETLGLKRAGLATVELVDTPGIDEVNGEQREALAIAVAQRADLILFVVSGDITQIEYDALATLRQVSKPMLLVFNKIDQYPEADRLAVYQKIRDERLKALVSPDEIVMVAAAPLEVQAVRQADGQVQVKRMAGNPQVEPLTLKILDVLSREGQALVALNTLLFADEANGQIVARKMALRDRSADELIWNASLAKATAIAINPVTVLDVLGGAAVDVFLILALSKLYGLEMTELGAIALLKKIALAMGGLGLSELLATLGLGSLKTLLGAAAPVTAGASLVPYVSVAATQAAVAGVSSYGIGQVTKTYLAQGATWGEEGPKAMAMRILASLDSQSILNRLKGELSEKLQTQTHTDQNGGGSILGQVAER
ncbi:MAG: DUF697 domain-containing protein [Synechococcales cyanobacterium RU_4_20]|nr:DUF697 domain-containing protein [Synechococcales cyanobacterium RU_4_20]